MHTYWGMFQIWVSENPMLHHNFPRSSSKCSIPGLGCKRKIKVLHKHFSQVTGCVPGPDSCCMCKDQLCVCVCPLLPHVKKKPNFDSCVYPHVDRAVVKTWVILSQKGMAINPLIDLIYPQDGDSLRLGRQTFTGPNVRNKCREGAMFWWNKTWISICIYIYYIYVIIYIYIHMCV